MGLREGPISGRFCLLLGSSGSRRLTEPPQARQNRQSLWSPKLRLRLVSADGQGSGQLCPSTYRISGPEPELMALGRPSKINIEGFQQPIGRKIDGLST